MPYGKPSRQLERGRSNRFLATLPPHDFALLTPHLRTVTFERGAILHDAGDEIERVYFLHSGMVSLVAVMRSGAAVETATIGRAGVIGASAGLGVKYSFARAIVQLPGTAAWLSASQFHAAANGSQAIRDLIVHYSGMLLAQVQQSVACNVLHTMEARLCRWLLQAHDCMDGNDIPLTQEFLGQMLGVRRTTVPSRRNCSRAVASSDTGAARSKSWIVRRSRNSPVSATPLYGVTRTRFFRPQRALDRNDSAYAGLS
jgi:CRP-like cAMP-binding protein